MTNVFAPRTPRGRTPAGKASVVKKRVRNAFGKAGKVLGRKRSVDFNPDRSERVVKVLSRAAEDGLLAGKETRVAGRVSPELIERAKRQTGIQSNTELLEFALANVALEDNFSEVFRKLRGTVNPALELGY